MPYSDLREFIVKLEQEKEIVRVSTEVDIHYEIGAICRHVLNQGGVEKNVALPPDTDELGLAGAFRGEPVDLVRCETIPLEVPATAEIVIEGEIQPGDMRLEGPFGEYTGYYGEKMIRPVISVRAITHRNGPIFQACYQGRPPN